MRILALVVEVQAKIVMRMTVIVVKVMMMAAMKGKTMVPQKVGHNGSQVWPNELQRVFVRGKMKSTLWT